MRDGDQGRAAGRVADQQPATGRPVFAFRLHQFLSKGDNVYVTLEPQATRHVTSTYQVAAPGRQRPGRAAAVLVPPAFCRECGQEYLVVTRSDAEGGRRYAARRDNDASGGDEASGYLFISDDQPWPSIAGAGAGRGPAAGLLADVSTRWPGRSSILPG